MASQRTSGKPGRRSVLGVRKRLSNESGLALVLALIVVAALSVATASMIMLVTSNQTAVGRDRQEERAFNIAEAGLNEAVSYLSTQDTLSISSVAATDYNLDNGSGQWWATKTASTSTVDTWTLYAQATSGSAKRKVSVKLAANKSTPHHADVRQLGQGVLRRRSRQLRDHERYRDGQPLRLRRRQPLPEREPADHRAHACEPEPLPLRRRPGPADGGPSQIGTVAAPIAQADIVNGCLVNGTAKICSNAAQSRVYANSYISTAQSLTKPPLDAAGTYAGGDWNHPVCSTGSFTFDGNGTRDSSVGSITLLPGSAYNCTVYKTSSHVAGNEMGTLSWNPATKALAASGILYLDGNLVMSGGNANFTGTGTIFVNGRVAISGNMTICGPGAAVSGSTCTGTWNAALGRARGRGRELRRRVRPDRVAADGVRLPGCLEHGGERPARRACLCRRLLSADRYLVRHRPRDDGPGGHVRHSQAHRRAEPAPGHARRPGTDGVGRRGGTSYPAVGARCRRAEWHFSPNPPLPMVRE